MKNHVRLKIAFACLFFFSALISDAQCPDITGLNSVCLGSSTSLSNTSAGGTWTSSNTGVATVGLNTGVVWGVSTGAAVITYSSTCGSVTATVTVGSGAPGPITGTVGPCTAQFANLFCSPAGGVWSSSNISVATIGSGGDLHTNAIGSTIISYNTGCGVSTRTVTITSQAPLYIYGTTVNALAAKVYLCVGGTTTLSNDGIPTGTWSSSNTSVATINATTGFLSSTGVPGTATITARNVCSNVTRYVDLVVADPTPISGNLTLCGTNTTTLSNGTPPGTWSSGNTSLATIEPATGVVHVVPGVVSGAVPITYTYAGGCFVDTVLTIAAGPPVISGAASVCAGASVTLSTSSPGGTWSSGSAGIATVGSVTGVVTGLSPGTAVITYATACGAVTHTVTVSAATVIAGSTEIICTGNTIALSNVNGGGVWSSSNTGVATVNAGGVVTGVSSGSAVISYATLSCSIYTTTITVSTGPGGIAGSLHICQGNITTLTNAAGGGTWSSSNTAVATITTATANVSTVAGTAAGTSRITYSVPGGCYSTATITVHAPLGPIAGKDTVCAGGTIQLSDIAGGGMWTSSAPAVATVNSSGLVTGGGPGWTIITHFALPAVAGNCEATKTVTVMPAVNAGNITGPSVVCVGDMIALTDAVSGGTWISSATARATVGATGIVSGVSVGVVTISYVLNSTCSAAAATHTITVADVPDAGIISGPEDVCAGGTIAMSDNKTGGTWTSGSPAIAAVTTGGMVSGVSAGMAVISYSVTNACGTAVATYTVTVAPSQSAGTITGPDSLCKGVVFTMNGTVPGGVWSTGNAAVATVVNTTTGRVLAVSEGIAIITYTVNGSGGCAGVATHTLTVIPPSFIVNAAITPISCHGAADGSIDITISGSELLHDYVWSTGSTAHAIANLKAGLYILNVTEQTTQCRTDTSFVLTDPDTLVVAGNATADLCGAGMGAAAVYVTGGVPPYSYLWSTATSDTDSHVEHLHAGVYTITVTDKNNCVSAYNAMIADSTCGNIKIHDVITPNGDGINDVWVIEGIGGYPGSQVQVFDKWGDKIFEKRNYQNDWNGNGLPDGTYYYKVKLAATAAKSEEIFTGTLLIKR